MDVNKLREDVIIKCDIKIFLIGYELNLHFSLN